jgi:hypothetical protein
MDTPTLYAQLIALLRDACQRTPPPSAVHRSLRDALNMLEDVTGAQRSLPTRAEQRAERWPPPEGLR